MKTDLPIYLDNNATTPVDPEVFEAMAPFLQDKFGNAASRSHAYGWVAEEAVDYAREQVAKLIGARSQEIIWTSGATESDNMAIKGVARMYGMTDAEKVMIDALAKGHVDGSIPNAADILPGRFGRLDFESIAEKGAFEVFKSKGDHIITLPTEHKAILDSCKRIEKDGFRVTYVPVKANGLVDLEELEKAITEKTIIVSIMMGNNEIGVVQPVKEIGELCRKHKVLFHTDAVQAIGKIPVNVDEMNIDLMSLSGHKMYGPKGVGALYVRRRNPRVRVEALIDGGGHERGMRSGTLNVAGIVGMGKAAEVAHKKLEAEQTRTTELRNKMWTRLQEELDELYLNGDEKERLPGNLNISDGFTKLLGGNLFQQFTRLLGMSPSRPNNRENCDHVCEANEQQCFYTMSNSVTGFYDFKLHYPNEKPCIAFSDANWADTSDEKLRSTSGFCIFVFGICLMVDRVISR